MRSAPPLPSRPPARERSHANGPFSNGPLKDGTATPRHGRCGRIAEQRPRPRCIRSRLEVAMGRRLNDHLTGSRRLRLDSGSPWPEHSAAPPTQETTAGQPLHRRSGPACQAAPNRARRLNQLGHAVPRVHRARCREHGGSHRDEEGECERPSLDVRAPSLGMSAGLCNHRLKLSAASAVRGAAERGKVAPSLNTRAGSDPSSRRARAARDSRSRATQGPAPWLHGARNQEDQPTATMRRRARGARCRDIAAVRHETCSFVGLA